MNQGGGAGRSALERLRHQRVVRSRWLPIVVAVPLMVPGYAWAASHEASLPTGILTSLWLVPFGLWLNANIRYRHREGADEPAQALLEAIRRDHPEV